MYATSPGIASRDLGYQLLHVLFAVGELEKVAINQKMMSVMNGTYLYINFVCY